MFADELTTSHVGMDVTINIDGQLTGGILRSVTANIMGVTLDLDGTKFNLPGDKPVELNPATRAPYVAVKRPLVNAR